ncbi:MAG: hypothetical protein IJJ15_08405 [Ruminococcus sp.]|nr:hypothetical protein [Ruminococcus sp.]
MRINVKGDSVSDKIVKLYVSELVKAHPDKDIQAVDIIVSGDFLKVKMFHSLERTA